MTSRNPGVAVRELRRRRGWSLGDVARRAGTSAATICRYESGWARFEVFTLRKLARALDCELDIRFVPAAGPARTNRAAVARRIRRLFWDRPLRAADLDLHPAWVVARVLEFGQLPDVNCLVRWMGEARFLDEVAGLHLGDPRARALWQGILKLEGRRCTRKFSRSEAAVC